MNYPTRALLHFEYSLFSPCSENTAMKYHFHPSRSQTFDLITEAMSPATSPFWNHKPSQM